MYFRISGEVLRKDLTEEKRLQADGHGGLTETEENLLVYKTLLEYLSERYDIKKTVPITG